MTNYESVGMLHSYTAVTYSELSLLIDSHLRLVLTAEQLNFYDFQLELLVVSHTTSRFHSHCLFSVVI